MGEWVREVFGEDRGIVGGEDIDRWGYRKEWVVEI